MQAVSDLKKEMASSEQQPQTQPQQPPPTVPATCTTKPTTEAIYNCTNCDIKFDSESSLRVHLQVRKKSADLFWPHDTYLRSESFRCLLGNDLGSEVILLSDHENEIRPMGKLQSVQLLRIWMIILTEKVKKLESSVEWNSSMSKLLRAFLKASLNLYLNTLRKQCLEFRGSWEEMYFATTCLLLKWWKWKRYKHKSIRISPQKQVHITNQCISIFWIETRFRKEKYHSFSKRKSSFLLLFPWQLRCSWK